jgi:pimeloyl-ACP methyl ester carboxylesterase
MADAGNLFYQIISDPEGISGGSLVFIHGAGGTHSKWAALMEKSINGFTHVAIDLMHRAIKSLV